MLEHDEDDRYITQSVIDEDQYAVSIEFLSNSGELFKYLETCIEGKSQLPSLMLVNYHAYPMNASEILKKIKADMRFQHIPLVVLSGSVNPAIIKDCYRAGASSFIRKPSSGKDTRVKISTFIRYWFETVELM
jgi:CheY-like chemotaxis protein